VRLHCSAVAAVLDIDVVSQSCGVKDASNSDRSCALVVGNAGRDQ
jgi:hypothetical protein